MLKSKLYRKVKNIITREEGASMGEYAILLAVVTIALLGAIQLFGTAISGVFGTATTTMNTAAGS